MYSVILTVTLTLEGPILSKSTSIGGYGLDAVMAKNHKKQYYLPGTLIKGRLRQAIEELRRVDPTLEDFNNSWLGKKSGNSDNKAPVEPMRTRLNFNDFIYKKSITGEVKQYDTHQTLHRIKIDKERGSVEKGALLVMDAPFAVGEHIDFNGKISFTAKNESDINNVKNCIEIGLKWISAFGSEKSVGFGKLLKVDIAEPKKEIINTPSHKKAVGNEFIDIIIQPDGPFCFAKRQVTKNLFESEDIIPGNAIKGALVSTWAGILGKNGNIEIDEKFDPDRKELSENFAKIRFTHAFPVQDNTKNERPVVAPLSLVKSKKTSEDREEIYDLAFQKLPTLINAYAPAFATDWKDRSDVDKVFGWDEKPDRELRIRTRIDRKRRKAEDKTLFAYEMVIPQGFKWSSRIDLSRVDQSSRTELASQLCEILSVGLIGMSKTKTSAKIECPTAKVKNKIESKCELIDWSGGKFWVLTLQTPVILCNPANLNETSIGENILSEYKTVWDEISGETLELSHFFATQSLAGGYYLHKRFQGEKPYRPYLLTDAGSVFVLKEKTCAIKTIEKWLKYGLDLPEWAKTEYLRDTTDDNHWKSCPYIPENGYGEIAVNIHKYFPEEIKVYGE